MDHRIDEKEAVMISLARVDPGGFLVGSSVVNKSTF